MPASKGKGCCRWSTAGKHLQWQSVWGGVGMDRHRVRKALLVHSVCSGGHARPPAGGVGGWQTDRHHAWGKIIGVKPFSLVLCSIHLLFSHYMELKDGAWHRCDLPTLNFCSPSGTCATGPSGSHLILLSTLNRERVCFLVATGVVELSLLLVHLVSSISLPLPAGVKIHLFIFFSRINTCRIRSTHIAFSCMF